MLVILVNMRHDYSLRAPRPASERLSLTCIVGRKARAWCSRVVRRCACSRKALLHWLYLANSRVAECRRRLWTLIERLANAETQTSVGSHEMTDLWKMAWSSARFWRVTGNRRTSRRLNLVFMRKMSIRRAAQAVCEPKRIDFRFSSDDLDKPPTYSRNSGENPNGFSAHHSFTPSKQTRS